MSDDPVEDPEGASAPDSDDGAPPLSELADRVGERRDRATADGPAQRFEEEPFESLEADAIWDETAPGEEAAFDADAEVVEEGESTYVVPKRNFCEQCQHFGTPPEVTCTNEGTEIREFVDKDQVRVHDCPVVEERGFTEDGPLG